MKPSLLRRIAAFVVLLALAATAGAATRNVVLIVVDDLGWTDLGVSGSDLYRTPNIDRLAAEGMRFDNAYAACTVCSPTRAAIMSGRYPAALRCTDWIAGHQRPYAKLKVPDWTMYLPLEEHTLAEALREAGYRTAHLGKWHLGEEEHFWPENQGFEINLGGWKVGQPQRNAGARGYFSPYGNPRLADGPPDEYLTERLAREACGFIEANQGTPFFLNLWLYNVHTPLQAKAEKIARYEKLVRDGAKHRNATYAAMVEHVDDAVGRIMETLRRLNLDRNTLVIFTSDNGGLLGTRGVADAPPRVTSNAPLRAGKGSRYEGGVRVPLIVRQPGVVAAGKLSQVPAISMDLYPTILELAGVKVPEEVARRLDGVSLASVLQGKAARVSRDALYWHYPHYHSEGANPYGAIRKDDWKLIEDYETGGVELYHLGEDIGETRNLADSHAAKRRELLADLQRWRERIAAQMPTPNPAYDPARADSR